MALRITSLHARVLVHVKRHSAILATLCARALTFRLRGCPAHIGHAGYISNIDSIFKDIAKDDVVTLNSVSLACLASPALPRLWPNVRLGSLLVIRRARLTSTSTATATATATARRETRAPQYRARTHAVAEESAAFAEVIRNATAGTKAVLSIDSTWDYVRSPAPSTDDCTSKPDIRAQLTYEAQVSCDCSTPAWPCVRHGHAAMTHVPTRPHMFNTGMQTALLCCVTRVQLKSAKRTCRQAVAIVATENEKKDRAIFLDYVSLASPHAPAPCGPSTCGRANEPDLTATQRNLAGSRQDCRGQPHIDQQRMHGRGL